MARKNITLPGMQILLLVLKQLKMKFPSVKLCVQIATDIAPGLDKIKVRV
jgi:hypothetical protein